MTSSRVLLALFFLVGCGARTLLDEHEPGRDGDRDGGRDGDIDRDADPDAPPPRDGGPDALRDGGFDAPPVDGGPGDLLLDCSPPQMVRPGELAVVTAEARDGVSIRGEWAVDGPERVVVDGFDTPRATFRATTGGRYIATFEAMDASGRSGRCQTLVAVVNGPPIASCPGEVLLGPAGSRIRVAGAGFDDTAIVNYRWEIVSSRPETDVLLDTREMPVTEVSARVATTVLLRLTVTDEDGAMDSCMSTVRFTAPPVLACPSAPIVAPTRQPLVLTVPTRDDTMVVDFQWMGVSWPATESGIAFTSVVRETATFVPGTPGRYRVRYAATDSDGLRSECLIDVMATPTPPTLTCPTEVSTAPMRPVAVTVMAEDDGPLTDFTWELSLDGTDVETQRTRGPIATVTPMLAGRHDLDVTVRDSDGNTQSCRIALLAVSDDGLRVEVLWNTDRTDMDTHLLNPTATHWFNGDDCYYANCRRGLAWEPPGTENDPFLDIDDMNGFGPENINIEQATPGTYRVGVHAFRGNAGVTVRIYCGGSRVDPVLELGPTRLTSNQFWRVADVNIVSAFDCSITPLLNAAGAPDVNTRESANTRR